MADFFRGNFIKLREMAATLDENKDRRALQALNTLLEEDEALEAQFGVFARTLFAVGRIYGDNQIQNRKRFPALMQLDKLRDEAGASISGAVAPREVHDAISAADNQHEFSVRVFAGLNFFEEWVESEVHDFELLARTDRPDCAAMLGELKKVKAQISEVMESCDPKVAEAFVRNIIEHYVEGLNLLYKTYFS